MPHQAAGNSLGTSLQFAIADIPADCIPESLESGQLHSVEAQGLGVWLGFGSVLRAWALDKSMFQSVVGHFGLSPVIALMVTPLNARLPVVLCPFTDLAALCVNVLSVPWKEFSMANTFPPWL